MPESPYKQPEGKCTGTTPYDGGLGNQDGDGKKPAGDAGGEKK
jgi:hypothetical protein